MSFVTLLRPSGTIDRGQYALAGVFLFALKYNLDRLVSTRLFGRTWSFSSYVDVPGVEAISALSAGDMRFGLSLVALAVPFVWVGTVLTLKRLRSAGLPGWLVLLFFAPLANLIFFATLCVVPQRASYGVDAESGNTRRPLDRFIPEGRFASAAMAVALTAPAGVIGTYLSVNVFTQYGWGLFVGIPFGLGMVAAMLHGYHHERSATESLLVAVSSITLLGGLLTLVAAEGLICLVMAAPIAFSLAVIGGGLGFAIQRRSGREVVVPVSVVAMVAAFALIGFEGMHDADAPLVAVSTAVDVQAPPEEVWNKLIAFSDIPEPTEWVFKTGIAYPIRATIEGEGVGAVRRCEFSTGSFVEPITVWQAPHELSFTVASMPDPMQEWTFYQDLRPAHIDGYFQTERGRFLLSANDRGGTRLEGTTWYRNRMWPNNYWNMYADALLHRIHLRVLQHIKSEAEGLGRSNGEAS